MPTIEEQIKSKENELSRLGKVAKRDQDFIAGQKKQIEVLETTISDLEMQSVKMSDQVSEDQVKYKDVKALLDEQHSILDELKRISNDYRVDNEELIKTNKTLANKIASYNRTSTELEAAIEGSDKDFTQKIADGQKSLEELTIKISEKIKQITMMDGDISERLNTAEELDTSIALRKKELEEKENVLKAKIDEANDLWATCTEKEDEINDMNRVLNERTELADKKTVELIELEDKLTNKQDYLTLEEKRIKIEWNNMAAFAKRKGIEEEYKKIKHEE